MTVIARVVLPETDVSETIALYLDEVQLAAVELRGRRSLLVRPQGIVSFGSYFNAFPAAYWRRYTSIRAVRLDVAVDGSGTIAVWRSDGAARASLVERRSVEGASDESFDLPLTEESFAEGGAYWFDLSAGASPLVLRMAEWSVEQPNAHPVGTVTIGMTTFNRPAECLAQLRTIADDPHLAEVVDRVVIVDQGEDTVSNQGAFAAVADDLGSRLEIVRQRNLGGSGGFPRAMAEVLRRGESEYILLLDDDAISEPEAIARAVRFADAALGPTIVGGGMIHLDAPNVLYTQSEQWDHRIGWVRLNRPQAYNHDFASAPYRRASYFHALQQADFNGWWMCLIPVALLREAGLSMPLFIKNDDIEFALRAREHGVPTVSPPGIAVWHLGWGDKAPTRTWQAYFLHRNRLITELLHNPRRRATGVVLHSFLGDAKALRGGHRAALRARAQAVVDLLRGPGSLPALLETRATDAQRQWDEPLRGSDAGALLRSIRLAVRLWLRWPDVADDYRAGLDALVSPESWEAILRADDSQATA
jgi:galactofuranosylgalactofuranosylrhamnosyl-N-acetylglucosaminyl-diphospho-decaprenol beta-1,5/1,6-galactofuranosyltransferase